MASEEERAHKPAVLFTGPGPPPPGFGPCRETGADSRRLVEERGERSIGGKGGKTNAREPANVGVDIYLSFRIVTRGEHFDASRWRKLVSLSDHALVDPR